MMQNEAENWAPSDEDRRWAMWAHLSGLVFVVVPVVGGLLGAFVFWLIKKDASHFVADQSKEALNFHLVMVIVQLINSALMAVLIGFLFYGIVWLFMLGVVIIAAVRAEGGTYYRYPLVPRLLT
ncbi:MAG TPA: DUF4870 domain-containing protein [Alcanivoracaceae bacterium]|nr:DUF4870 domain-containing protein [Alcanivoracaceae bacterium]